MFLGQMINIFKTQQSFNERVIEDWKNIKQWKESERKYWFDRQLTAYLVEFVELVDSTNWKWWKKYEKEEDIQNIHVELVDMLHFLVSLYQINNSSAETFMQHWESKKESICSEQDSIYEFSSKYLFELGVCRTVENLEGITLGFKNLCKKYNLSDESIYNKYHAKNIINHKRQDKGYSTSNKDVNDCKHI